MSRADVAELGQDLATAREAAEEVTDPEARGAIAKALGALDSARNCIENLMDRVAALERDVQALERGGR